MSDWRRIVFIAYEGAELLDIAGPAAVFAAASALDGRARYECVLAVPGGGRVVNGCGLALLGTRLEDMAFCNRDTVLVAGSAGKNLEAHLHNAAIRAALRSASQSAGRYGSVCTGAFLLAAAGLVGGKRIATHWAGQERLMGMFSDAVVDLDALYVNDGRLWTSAGVTAGIDMALAILEKDHGARLKSRVAKHLVVYAHRPGYQSQFSELLSAQIEAGEGFGGLVEWLGGRLERQTKVADMADYAGMSERTFYRQFTETFGRTPAKFLEDLRLNAAKALIEAGTPIKAIPHRIGFKSEAAFRTAFKNRFGIAPALHAQMHGMGVFEG